VLSTTYGTAPPGFVSLPNLRGYFLRGYDGMGRVGDRSSAFVSAADVRFDGNLMLGAKTGHPDGFPSADPDNGQVGNLFIIQQGEKFALKPSSGPDTQPKNLAVHWIIRVR